MANDAHRSPLNIHDLGSALIKICFPVKFFRQVFVNVDGFTSDKCHDVYAAVKTTLGFFRGFVAELGNFGNQGSARACGNFKAIE